MAEQEPRKKMTWLELRIKKQLNQNAKIPVSQEQIDEAVAARRKELEIDKHFKIDLFDIRIEEQMRVLRSRWN